MSITWTEVEAGVTEISYSIRKAEGLEWTDDTRYDWVLPGGEESDVWFETAEEARQDVKTYFG